MRLLTALCLLLAAGTGTATSTMLAAPPPGPVSMRCGTTEATLTAGMTVAQWRLGSVHFMSPGAGVAVTAAQIYCHSAAGVVSQAQRVLLAVSTDGGGRWVTEGTALPAATVDQVAAFSTRAVWALTSAGTLYATANGGRTWTRQRFPGPVLTITQADGELTALFHRTSPYGPGIDTLRLPGGSWRPVPVPPLDTKNTTVPQLAFAGGGTFGLLIGPELISSTDGGARWTSRSVPAAPDGICRHPGLVLTATAPGELWVLCEDGQGMQKATQVLLRTGNDGRTWQVMSQILGPSSRPGALPFEGPTAIAAFSPALLWIVGLNYIAYSTDAGRTWSVLTTINPAESYPVTLDVQSPARAWLLAPGAGMWRTTDGLHWVQLGPYFPG
ncbi:MAG TPA: hypothetical protein VN969_33360 [Streptosporangiaceae bacterium]|nr:hypothetical protein [Streptosporangiaceae bacterium]